MTADPTIVRTDALTVKGKVIEGRVMPHTRIVKDYVESLKDQQIKIREHNPENEYVEIEFFVPLIASAEKRNMPGYGVTGVIKMVGDMSLSFHIEDPEGNLVMERDGAKISEDEAHIVSSFMGAHLLQLKSLVDHRESLPH